MGVCAKCVRFVCEVLPGALVRVVHRKPSKVIVIGVRFACCLKAISEMGVFIIVIYQVVTKQ